MHRKPFDKRNYLPGLVIAAVPLLVGLLMFGIVSTAFAQAETYPQRVSVASDGTQANDYSDRVAVAISGDGRYVVFSSQASNLVANDTNGVADIFVRDRITNETTRISVASDGTEGNGSAGWATISGDGRYVAFSSKASNLVPNDTNNTQDVFVHDRTTSETTRVSVTSSGGEANGVSETYASSLSADGRYVTFYSRASNLVPDDTNNTWDTFVHDRTTGETNRVSVASDGADGNGQSDVSSVTSDGRFIAFSSEASNLVPDDTNNTWDIFVHDRTTGETTRVSVASDGTEANDSAYLDSISADGRYVAFVSSASNLVPIDTNNNADVFVHDRTTGETTRVSVSSDGTEGNGGTDILSTALSGNGRYVTFVSSGSSLVPDDTNQTWDTFVHDRETGETARVSVASDGTEGNGTSYTPSLSADGRYIAFASAATNLVPNDTNGMSDVFVTENPFFASTAPLTLGEQAAVLATAVVNAPYLGDGDTFGGKGWDLNAGEFVAPQTVFDGYNFWNNKLATTSFGAGLDCSGLVMWAFNRANEPTKSYKENIVKYEGADGQYRNNVEPAIIAEEDLQPGDLLFFSAGGNPDNFKEHVAMYVGGAEGFEIVEARSPLEGILFSDFATRIGTPEFINQFRRIANADIGASFDVASPVDIIVTDPDGFTITSTTAIETEEEYLREIPGELYYSEMTLGHDGKPADSVYSPVLKNGSYRVQVTPDPDALPTDTYSLTFTANGSTTVLADSAPISSIPVGGLVVEVTDGAVTSVTFTEPEPTSPNLLTNSSFETSAGWRTGFWTSSTGVIERTTTDVHTGEYSYVIDGDTTTSGGQVYSDTINRVPVTPGTRYTFSVWYKGANAYLSIKWFDAAGNELSSARNNFGLEDSTDWQYAEREAVAPTGAITAWVFVQARNSADPVYFDDLYFADTLVQVPTELTNAGFETEGGWLSGFWTSSKGTIERTTTDVHTGDYAYIIDGDTTTSGGQVYSDVANKLAVTEGQSYRFSAWYKGMNVYLVVKWLDSDGNELANTRINNRQQDSVQWREGSVTVTPPIGATTAWLFLQSRYNSAPVYVDDLDFAEL